MGRYFKVWIEIEELDSRGNPGDNPPVLPDCVGVFTGKNGLKEAMERVGTIVETYGIDPEHSNCVARSQRLR